MSITPSSGLGGGTLVELADLQAFVEAAESGTFTAAAARLHTTQPSLSRRIARLERELGCLFFDRVNRRAPRLTPLGELTVPHARHLLAEFDRFLNGVGALAQGRDAVLTVAVSAAAGGYSIPLLRQQINEVLADVHLQIVECPPASGVRNALLDREVELALLDPGFLTSEIEGVTIGVANHVAVGQPELLGTHSVPLEWEELRSMPLLLTVPATEVAYPVNGTRLRVVHENGSPSVLLGMASAGMGVAILAGVSTVPGLVVRPIAMSGIFQRTRLQLAWRREALLSVPARALVQHFRARLMDQEPRVLATV